MTRKALVFRGALGALLVLVGVVLGGVNLVAFIDPVGVKGSDDNDPFGPPPSRTSSAILVIVGAALLVGGVACGIAPLRRGRDRG